MPPLQGDNVYWRTSEFCCSTGYETISSARLMKIANITAHGKRDSMSPSERSRPKSNDAPWDRVYITTLFSFRISKIAETIISRWRPYTGRPSAFCGGYRRASLMHERFLAEPRWRGVRFIKGLLDKPPPQALQLYAFDGDFYADDLETASIEI